jgi:hypothetical protein
VPSNFCHHFLGNAQWESRNLLMDIH